MSFNADQVYSFGPGKIYKADVDAAAPTFAITNDVFSMTIDDEDWSEVGYTDDGITMSFSRSTTDVTVAEELKPIRKTTTESQETVTFALAQTSAENFAMAFNLGITSTGTGTSIMHKLSPKALGAEERVQLMWVSADNKIAFIAYKCFQTGSAETKFGKAGEKTVIPVEFTIEVVTGDDYNWYLADDYA